jgi:catechol 2,3-dioxygenase-like lactoylglutathione lyase family enzyme
VSDPCLASSVSADPLRAVQLDHLVLTVRDIEASVDFYERVLGMQGVTFGAGRRALVFGIQKINLHPADAPLAPHAATPTRGSADLCFVIDIPVSTAIGQLRALGVAVEQGPVPRTGARGPMTSAYFRDPDGNLIEVSNYDD